VQAGEAARLLDGAKPRSAGQVPRAAARRQLHFAATLGEEVRVNLRSIALIVGLAAIALATLAWLADRRRLGRANPDAVGFMPWTTLFFWACLVALLALALAVKEWEGD
jgi:hypothetical protein